MLLTCGLLGGRALNAAQSPSYAVENKTIAQLQSDLSAGRVTSEQLVEAYLARIAAIDVAGPALHSVIVLNPHAVDDARASDAQRRLGQAVGPLQGIPVLIKDNIETGDGTPTTAGSEALAFNITRRDAPLVRRLKEAGAIVLGKTNLSEWANIRSSHSISGWSALGGLVKNPYALDRTPSGSSSGTAAAIAASLAAVGVGTETDGSVTSPSSVNGIVGIKPTLGLVSRTYVVPISHSQDTPGPMGRSVADVAALLTVMAGTDPRDPATRDADRQKRDYVAALRGATLSGKRLGVLRFATGNIPATDALFERALGVMRAHGARIVELKSFKPNATIGDMEMSVLMTELKADLNRYLASTPPAVTSRTLAAVIRFNRAHARELSLFDQDLFERAQKTNGLSDPTYLKTLRKYKLLAGREGIDKLITAHQLDGLIAPSDGPAGRVDVLDGDRIPGVASMLPAIAGYPHLTVPMGYVSGMPVGISFIGRAWTDAQLLALGAAYERATRYRRAPAFTPSVEGTQEIQRSLAPEKGLRL
ncbi:MAG: amidase [Candidatus Eremiobacteraeota bacterium]|nr:amidase [Candidatus Eremiobacteraeota bacterium]MBV9647933.1 amidase [Candidatus Eremiobacteraeota bacterium]